MGVLVKLATDSVIGRHGPFDSRNENRFDGIRRGPQHRVDIFPRRARNRLQNESCEIGNRMIRSNAEPHAGKVLGSESGDDRLQAIVPPGRTSGPHADSSERQRDVVDGDNDVGRQCVVARGQGFYRITAQIHVGLGLRQSDIAIGQSAAPDEGLFFRAIHTALCALGEQVDEQEPEVVPCQFVLRARISEANDELHLFAGC